MAKVTTQSERIALSRRDGSDEQGRGRPKDFEEKKKSDKRVVTRDELTTTGGTALAPAVNERWWSLRPIKPVMTSL